MLADDYSYLIGKKLYTTNGNFYRKFSTQDCSLVKSIGKIDNLPGFQTTSNPIPIPAKKYISSTSELLNTKLDSLPNKLDNNFKQKYTWNIILFKSGESLYYPSSRSAETSPFSSPVKKPNHSSHNKSDWKDTNVFSDIFPELSSDFLSSHEDTRPHSVGSASTAARHHKDRPLFDGNLLSVDIHSSPLPHDSPPDPPKRSNSYVDRESIFNRRKVDRKICWD